MHFRDIAISKLLSSNYSIFLPLNTASSEIVLIFKGQLQLCTIKATRDTARGPNIIFSTAKAGHNLLNFNYIVPVDTLTNRCWLIPVADLDLSKKSMMLSAFSNEYSLIPQVDNLGIDVLQTQHKLQLLGKAEKSAKNETVQRDSSDNEILNLLKGSKNE